jgi:hypothetical protein
MLTFRNTYRYPNTRSGITVPITLIAGDKRVAILSKLDTGAAYCIFQREHGEALGLDIEAGAFLELNAVGIPVPTFGHMVGIESFDWTINSTVFFAKEYDFPRNLLGRNGWIQKFRLGLIDYDSTLYISHYDDE